MANIGHLPFASASLGGQPYKREPDMNGLDMIIERIEQLRDKLHIVAKGRELSDPEVVLVDQELNQALNQYYALYYALFKQR